jgi:phospholipid-translocating ATPase
MIENSNVVLRGCSLKINEWAIGLCVYTGHETKILLNSGSQKRKISKL